MDKFWSPEAGALDAPRIPPPPRCLQMAHFCIGLTVFWSKEYLTKYIHWKKLLYVRKSMRQRDSNWFPLEGQLQPPTVPKSVKDLTKLKFHFSKWTFIYREYHSADMCGHKTIPENLYFGGRGGGICLQSPLFPGWNLRHVTWYMAGAVSTRWRESSACTRIHSIVQFLPFHPDQWWLRHPAELQSPANYS